VAANPEQGEVDLVVCERVYTLKLTTKASKILQKRTGKTVGEVMKQIAIVDVDAFCEVLHASLQKYHGAEFPYSPKGEEAIETLVDVSGGWKKLVPTFVELLGVKKKADEALAEQGPNPPEAQAGTGERSTSSGDASA